MTRNTRPRRSGQLSYGERQIRTMVEALRRGEAVDVAPKGEGRRQRDLAAQRATWLREAQARLRRPPQ